MYALLELYARPLSRAEPVICIDEKGLQLIGHSREPLPMTEWTPAKHASWLNMAEIEIGILSRQCLNRRIDSRQFLRNEVATWQQARNALKRTIEWKFTRQDTDQKLGRHYVPTLAC